MHPASELILRFCRSERSSRPDGHAGSKAASHIEDEADCRSEPGSRQSEDVGVTAAILLINPPRDTLAIELHRTSIAETHIFTQDFGDQKFFEASGINSQFGLLPDGSALPSTVILFLPREKERLEFVLHFIGTHIPVGGQLWLVGENKAGIKSAETRLKHRFSNVQKRDAARHCVLYLAQDPEPWRAAGSSNGTGKQDPIRKAAGSIDEDEQDHLWKAGTQDVRGMLDQSQKTSTPDRTGDPALMWERALLATNPPKGQDTRENKSFSPNNYLQAWNLETKAGEIKLLSLPGAFAQGRLDKGTALLLDYLQNADSRQLKIKGKVLDFGCGSGVIGLYLKRQYPDIDLEMLDTSAIALESARLSLQLNGIDAKLTASDGLDAAKGRYDWIISNPPFHKGVCTDLDIARRFIGNAPAKLGNRGRMLLVCNRHLPYEAWLTDAFVGFEKVTENREFKVLQAHGPRRL